MIEKLYNIPNMYEKDVIKTFRDLIILDALGSEKAISENFKSR